MVGRRPLLIVRKGPAGRSVASRLVVACFASYPPVRTDTGDAGAHSRSSATLTLGREPYIVCRTPYTVYVSRRHSCLGSEGGAERRCHAVLIRLVPKAVAGEL